MLLTNCQKRLEKHPFSIPCEFGSGKLSLGTRCMTVVFPTGSPSAARVTLPCKNRPWQIRRRISELVTASSDQSEKNGKQLNAATISELLILKIFDQTWEKTRLKMLFYSELFIMFIRLASGLPSNKQGQYFIKKEDKTRRNFSQYVQQSVFLYYLNTSVQYKGTQTKDTLKYQYCHLFCLQTLLF